MHVLLVEPAYYSRYPPLGLLKLATYHKLLGNTVELVRGRQPVARVPDKVYVTSLFTYAWQPVHQAVAYYKRAFPVAKLVVGGIYATLMPEHAARSGADEVHSGLFADAEDLLPDYYYSSIPGWRQSIVFSHRGCVNHCPYCAVPLMEKSNGPITVKAIRHLVAPGHTKVVLWDNNLLGATNWRDLIAELKEIGLPVDFNQGLDARRITQDVAQEFRGLRISPVRMAYDVPAERRALERAIPALAAAGFNRRRMIVYVLYNFHDSPEEFLDKVRDLLDWGVVAYPMRFEPLNSLKKNQHVGPKWTAVQLEMVARARRVIGYGGAFPPYEGLRKKFLDARSFEEAFALRPRQRLNDDGADHHDSLQLTLPLAGAGSAPRQAMEQ
ncbi:MAG: hypothetical protein HYY01_08640 [Chloroflexi bacterium]|nr:hypothetical protein [Chloroflexota bacterium]